MIHRAILGSFERFIGILLEHTAGELPFWIAHTQVAIVPISQNHHAYAKQIADELLYLGADSVVLNRNETLNKRIRNAEKEHVPLILVLGDNELESKSVAVRDRMNKTQYNLTLEEFYKMIQSKLNEVAF